MGSLVSGIFDLASGDPTKSEESALGDLSEYQNNLGQQSTSQGLGWESDILSGDPTKIAQALAPEIKTGQEQIQQQAQQNAQFGNRGGGTNASTQAAQSGERGNIINLIGGMQQGAASELTGAGLNLMGQGSTNLMNQAGLASANQARTTSDVGGIASGAGQIASDIFTGGAASGMDPGIFNSLMPQGTVQPAQLDMSTATPEEIPL